MQPISGSFGRGRSQLDGTLVQETAGILSRDEWLAKAKAVSDRHESEAQAREAAAARKEEKAKLKRKREKAGKRKGLSFAEDDGDDEVDAEAEAAAAAAAAPAAKRPRTTDGSEEEEEEEEPVAAAAAAAGASGHVSHVYLPNAGKDAARQRKEALRELAVERDRRAAERVTVRVTSAGRQGGRSHSVATTLGATVEEVLSGVYKEDKALATAFSSHDCVLYCGNVVLPSTVHVFSLQQAEDTAGKRMFALGGGALRVILRRHHLERAEAAQPRFLTYAVEKTYEAVGKRQWREVEAAS